MSTPSSTRKLGGTTALAYIKDKQPVFDNELGIYICGEVIAPGHVCKDTPIAPRWRCSRHGGNWKPTTAALQSRQDRSIYTTKGLWRGYHNIHKELTNHPEYIEQLYTSSIGEELAISRILCAELMQRKDDEEVTIQDKDLILKALRLIAKIAKTAKEIQVAESNVIKREFMDGIIAAVTHAFTRSNAYNRPSDRARIFMQEFSSMLPGASVSVSVDDVVEGKAKTVPDDEPWPNG